jgi:hypothetical protein
MISNDRFNNVLDPGEVESIPQLLYRSFSDWYVPSVEELKMIYYEKALLKDHLGLSSENRLFWSSNEGGRIWQGHGDGPRGDDLPGGTYFEGFSGKQVKLIGEYEAKDDNAVKEFIDDQLGVSGGKSWVRGALCVDFFTGKTIPITKTYPKSLILIRRF